MANSRADEISARLAALFTELGPLGVTEIAKHTGITTSTLQRFLHNQKYYKMGEGKKWDFPKPKSNRAKLDFIGTQAELVDTAIRVLLTHIEDLKGQVEYTFPAIEALRKELGRLEIADNSSANPAPIQIPGINKQMIELHENIRLMSEVFKKYAPTCPEEYQDIIANVDLYTLTLSLGKIYVNEEFNEALTDLFLKKTDVLSDAIVTVLSDYQKEDSNAQISDDES